MSTAMLPNHEFVGSVGLIITPLDKMSLSVQYVMMDILVWLVHLSVF